MFVFESATAAREESASGSRITATLLIATYNRAALLEDTLRSVALLRTPPDVAWDVVIADNNSIDNTREIVTAAAEWFPVPLTYVFEPRQGKSIALNTALSAISSSIVLFSDDDVRVPEDWLQMAIQPFVERPDIAYVGGPVRPRWGGTRPVWLENSQRAAGVLALLDYGSDPFVFEERRLIPLGVNMGVRRSLIHHVGGFNAALGRRGSSLLGQEQAEFFLRCRRIGARGLYVPEMRLEHVVPAYRLSLRYFSRWWFWKGVSHARWYRMHKETELGVDLSKVSRFFGVPLFVYGSAINDAAAAVCALVTGARARAADRFFMVAFFAGYVREAWFGPRRFEADRPLSDAPPARAADMKVAVR